MFTHTALVRYAAGQFDDEGQTVGTEPFYVDFEMDTDSDLIEAIADTGRVQFDWILEGVA